MKTLDTIKPIGSCEAMLETKSIRSKLSMVLTSSVFLLIAPKNFEFLSCTPWVQF